MEAQRSFYNLEVVGPGFQYRCVLAKLKLVTFFYIRPLKEDLGTLSLLGNCQRALQFLRLAVSVETVASEWGGGAYDKHHGVHPHLAHFNTIACERQTLFTSFPHCSKCVWWWNSSMLTKKLAIPHWYNTGNIHFLHNSCYSKLRSQSPIMNNIFGNKSLVN